ncbi:winged helix-turn-helix transcriptional regulator [Variovorax sp. 350MFTsu5.1]|uniref:winged helix-turn-helix transcriptional regulator n=1 Tax=Variovorax sp. 350MFTsu5.1 TaxID=3158365 RepID=UPI003AAAB10D
MKVLPINEQRLDVPSPRHCLQCPVEDWLGFLGHRWNALLLWHLQDGARRHSELAALLPGVSPKVLSERLQGLEARGLLERFLITGFPRGVGYGLTSFGKALVPVLNQLEVWSRHFDHPVA